jgi:hypothetical protein
LVAYNAKALAMWLEFIALSARLPMPGKGKMFRVKYKCLIAFLPTEPQPNRTTSAQWHFRQASHIANAMLWAAILHSLFEYFQPWWIANH